MLSKIKPANKRARVRADRLRVWRESAAFSWSLTLSVAIAFLSAGCGEQAGEQLRVTPNAIDLGTAKLNESIQVAAPRAGARLSISAQFDAPWLTVSPSQFFSAGPNDSTAIVFSVARAAMKPGRNTCLVRFTSPGYADTLVHVAANAIVSADFRVSNARARPGELVLFNDATRVLTGAAPVTAWKWDFGDGATSAERNPVHAYESTGSYTVSLSVTSTSGSDVRVRQNCVTVKQPAAPAADFVASTRRPIAGAAVQFKDLSVPGASGILSWLWDFGDGATSTEQHPQHLYTLSAVYDVYLTVRNKNGDNTAVKLGYIDVQAERP
ncbi:MAG: PKD domain-containing protein [Candidatus Hydrogenedentes bacterium]|nr:PKD domain-containing protein [Candidatus Hydrogenedentota bacterium]